MVRPLLENPRILAPVLSTSGTPPTEQVEKKQLILTVKQRDHLGEGRIREAVKRLVAGNRIQEIKQPRPNRTPAVMLQRVPVPPLPNVVHK